MANSNEFVTIVGQPGHGQIVERLKSENKPVLLAFSGGKDAICTLLHLRNHGIDVIPYHMEVVPGLAFVEKYLGEWEDRIGRHIIRIPHPSFWRWLRNSVYQTPDRVADLLASDLPNYSYEDVVTVLREDYATPTTWVADGVRAADSIVRRVSFATHGVMKEKSRKVSPIWDWKIAHIRECIADNNVELPPDYKWFGRSFDGIDRRFLGPLKEHSPADFDRILHFFPLAEMELLRHG